MGDLSTWDHYETYGGWPDPGEAHPSLEAADNLRKRQKEEGFHCHRDLSSSPGDANKRPPAAGASPGVGSYCPACGAPKDAPCAPWCEANRG